MLSCSCVPLPLRTVPGWGWNILLRVVLGIVVWPVCLHCSGLKSFLRGKSSCKRIKTKARELEFMKSLETAGLLLLASAQHVFFYFPWISCVLAVGPIHFPRQESISPGMPRWKGTELGNSVLLFSVRSNLPQISPFLMGIRNWTRIPVGRGAFIQVN
jgi:hypothetical protein